MAHEAKEKPAHLLGKSVKKTTRKRERQPRPKSRPADKTDALAVPPELVVQAQKVAQNWDMKLEKMIVAATKPEFGGAIWRIETSKGPRSLKLLHRPPARSLFSVAAQDYLVKQGARVPELVRTKADELFTIAEGKMWIVTEWILGLTQATKVDLKGAAALCEGLAEFHLHTRGYQPPAGAQFASRLRRWPKTYAKIRTKIDWFENLAHAYKEMPAAKTLLKVIPQFRKQADEAIQRLDRSPYTTLIERGEPAWGLVHQDFGWSNGQLGPKGLWVIDLDGVAYDLPIRDLRKLITSTMDDRGDWNLSWIEGMIKSYETTSEIEPELMQVMLIDMFLPNEFYKLVKDIVFDPTQMNQELDQQLQRLVDVDQNKQRALTALGIGRR